MLLEQDFYPRSYLAYLSLIQEGDFIADVWGHGSLPVAVSFTLPPSYAQWRLTELWMKNGYVITKSEGVTQMGVVRVDGIPSFLHADFAGDLPAVGYSDGSNPWPILSICNS